MSVSNSHVSQDHAERAAVLSRLCCELSAADRHGRPLVAADEARELTSEPVYPLPIELLSRIQSEMPRWLSRAEIELEQQFSELCNRSVGVFLGGFVQVPYLGMPAMPVISSELFTELGWDQYTTRAAAEAGLRRCSDMLAPVRERLASYVGWLMT